MTLMLALSLEEIYVVVQVVKDPSTGTPMYKVAVASREGVPEYGPRLPDPPLFPMNHVFRDFILKKGSPLHTPHHNTTLTT